MKKISVMIVTLLFCILLTFSVAGYAEETVSQADQKIILFTAEGVQCTAEDVLVDGTTVTISGSGEYTVQGECDNAQIRVLTPGKNNPVTLVLDNVTLRCADGPVLYAECKRLTLSLPEGSKNLLGDAPARKVPEDDTPDACIYGANHLTISGSGALKVEALVGRGIQCKDTLTIEGGILTVTSSSKDAIRANDGVTMLGGDVSLKSPKNGIETTKAIDGKGNILLQGGTLTVTSGKLPFNAAGSTHIMGCNVILWENEEE